MDAGLGYKTPWSRKVSATCRAGRRPLPWISGWMHSLPPGPGSRTGATATAPSAPPQSTRCRSPRRAQRLCPLHGVSLKRGGHRRSPVLPHAPAPPGCSGAPCCCDCRLWMQSASAQRQPGAASPWTAAPVLKARVASPWLSMGTSIQIPFACSRT